MGITVLGVVTVDGSGRLGPRDRVVLQALATCQGQPVSTEELIDALWGDHPPASAAKNLQSCVVRLRKALGPDAIKTSPHGYALVVPSARVDAQEFETQVTRARDLLTVGEGDRVAFLLEQALLLWRGPAFPDLPDWPPARREAGRLDELRLEAQEMYVDAMLRSGRPREVLAQAHAMVRAAPLRERRWELLVLAQYQTGAQGEALRSLRQLRAVLTQELGVDPAPEMVALEQSILKQDPSLVVPQPRGRTAHCPWQGLQAYDVDDSERFFGRDGEVQSCLDLLETTSFVALVGPSGSGKSSLMRAGVLAALRDRGHKIVVITPGRRPVEALTALPENANARTVLAVDQTEEVFALCEDIEERRDFLERLAHQAGRRPVILTLRGDRLSQVTEHAGFSRLVERGLHLVGALDEAALRGTVTGPAQQAGLILEPGLVDLLVREVGDDPGALPLLSHALLETWRRREGNTLTVDGYRASGGIHGAVAQSAEQLYGRVDPEQRNLLRDLVLRLVSPGNAGEAVRTQVPRRLIASDSHHEQLIEMLVDARLVTSDEGVLEITHEALARAWPRLRGWLDDDVEGQRIRHHLSGAADAWDTLGRPDSELYRGVRLTRALDWQSRTESTLTDTERDFLAAARDASDAEERSAAERAQAQARLIHRLRIVLSGAAVLLLLALLAGGIAAVQSDRASNNAARAEQAAVSADARRVGLRAQLTDDISLPLLLAAAGVRLDDSPETRANLLATLERRPTLVRSGVPGGGYLNPFVVSRNGRWIASSDDGNRMYLYDAATNRVLGSYDAGRPTEKGPGWISQAFSPDSSQLAIVPNALRSIDPVRLLDPQTMQEASTKLASPGRQPFLGIDIRFSADGNHLAASMVSARKPGPVTFGETPAWVMVWDLRSPSSRPARISTGTMPQLVVLSSDGQTLYTNRPVTAYDVATGAVVWQREELESSALDINPEGNLLALEDHATLTDALLVDAADGTTVHTLPDHRDWPSEARFSPDGTLLGTVARSGELTVWDTATGQRLHEWFTFDAWGVGFSPDNRFVYTGGGGDTLLRTWDVSFEETYIRRTGMVGGADLFARADLSPDGERVAYSWVDARNRGWIRFADTATGAATPRTRIPVSRDQRWFGTWPVGAWHPKGLRYAVHGCEDRCGERGVVTVLDGATGERVTRRDVLDAVKGDEWTDGDVWSLAYAEQGRILVVGDVVRTLPRGRTIVLDAESLQPRGEPIEAPAQCCTTEIGAGSTALVLETGLDGESEHWRVLDISKGEVLHHGVLDDFAYATAASPDGSTVAVAGANGEVVTIDVSTGDVQRRSLRLGTEVLWLHYSDDGERLVSGDTEGGVSLWDAATLERLGTVYPPHRGAPVSEAPASSCVAGAAPTCAGSGAQFIGDGHDLVIASYDGILYHWETDVDRAIGFACQMAGRDLTEEEWAQFLPTQPYQAVCPDE